jgi:hypothetical protein
MRRLCLVAAAVFWIAPAFAQTNVSVAVKIDASVSINTPGTLSLEFTSSNLAPTGNTPITVTTNDGYTLTATAPANWNTGTSTISYKVGWGLSASAPPAGSGNGAYGATSATTGVGSGAPGLQLYIAAATTASSLVNVGPAGTTNTNVVLTIVGN